MVFWNLKTALLFLVLLAIASNACAQQSELVLAVNNENKLFVEKLLDDDGSIGMVDICILTLSNSIDAGGLRQTLSSCHKFQNVTEGQVFDIGATKTLDVVGLAPSELMREFSASFTYADGQNMSDIGGSSATCYDMDGFAFPCADPNDFCNDGVCSATETCTSCARDCGNCPPELPNTRAAAYYNFIDVDGQMTNVKFMVFATNPTFAPYLQNVTETDQPNIVVSKNLVPVVNEDKTKFAVEVHANLLAENFPDSVNFVWTINDSGTFYRVRMKDIPDQPGEWLARVGYYEEPVIMKSFIEVTVNGETHLDGFGPRFFYLLKPGLDGTCQTATLSPAQKQAFPVKEDPATNAFFQAATQLNWPENVARVKLSASPINPNLFLVQRINDDDSSDTEIGFVTIFVATAGSIKKYDFQNVTQNQVLALDPESAITVDPAILGGPPIITDPSGKEIFYSFMDLDNSTGNVNFLIPLNRQEALNDIPIVPSDRQNFIEDVEMDVVPQADCSSFSIRFRTQAPANVDLSKVYLKYGFQPYNLTNSSQDHAEVVGGGLEKNNYTTGQVALNLQQGGGTYEGEIGPFSSALELFSRIYGETPSGDGGSWQNFFSWFGFGNEAGQAQQLNEEICGNGLDDDDDGAIDEGCVILPDLVFVGEGSIPAFVTAGDRMNVSATIKNAGVSNTAQFSVSFYLDEELIDSVLLNGLTTNEEKLVEFSVADSKKFLGLNNAKIVIDQANEVSELSENNNELLKETAIGFNTFNIVLNYNNSNLVGDTREFRAFSKELGKPEEGVIAFVTFPSGEKQQVVTNENGIENFVLKEGGIYFLTASKNRFDTFEASFNVPKITIANMQQRYEVGQAISFSVKTDDGKNVTGGVLEIMDPNSQLTEIQLDNQGNAGFQPKISGTHEVKLLRKGIQVFTGSFLVGGTTESIFLGGGVQELLFGSVAKDPPLFILMALLSLAAGAIVFTKSKLLFKTAPKSSREEQLENVARMFLGIAFFLLPFQIAKYFGFNAGLIIVILEVVAVFVYEYFKKTGKRQRPLIRV